ncbi:carbamate kinase [Enterococcus cecorum]|uniref:carbamate kinase n=1 Tax=Enterococcus cecorum TaxID=44008 RepID=UPI00200B74E6|nr:carbamate kinase [Enterococcus cecorum]
MAKIVVALGGNALGNSAKEQKEAIQKVVPGLVDLVEKGHQLIVSHGNGPQVGMINLAFTEYYENMDSSDELPFPECNAMSEGYIGYHLQNEITNECNKRKLSTKAQSIITQVEVSPDDPAFINPTKPIGKFYSKEEGELISQKYGYVVKEDAGRGYRRMVPSPKPLDIVEKEIINSLFNEGKIVIACGGGGIPVIQHDGAYEGIAAVIDKDFASAKLAELLDADYLIILTAVSNVYVNYGKETQKALKNVTVDELSEYIDQDQFSKGSMLPKVEAVINFVGSSKKRIGIITSINYLNEALHGQEGTMVVGS